MRTHDSRLDAVNVFSAKKTTAEWDEQQRNEAGQAIHCPKCGEATDASILYQNRYRCWSQTCNVTWVNVEWATS